MSPEKAELLNDNSLDYERKRACFEEESTERLRRQLMSDGVWPNIDTVLDLFRDNIVDMVDNNSFFRHALIEGNRERLGELVYVEFILARDEVIDGKIGQMVIEDIINEMAKDSGYGD